MLVAGITSVALHLGLLAILLAPRQPVLIPHRYLPLIVTVPKNPSVTRSASRKTTLSRPSNSVYAPLPLSRLGLPGLAIHSPPVKKPDPEGLTRTPWRGGYTSDIVQDTAIQPLLQILYRKIDTTLTYPIELKVAEVEGRVEVDLRFNTKGAFQELGSRFTETSPYLKVVVARCLRQALKDPLPEAYRAIARSGIFATFEFRITESNLESKLEAKRGIWQSTLAFYRNHHRTRIHQQLGPVHFFGPFLSVDLL